MVPLENSPTSNTSAVARFFDCPWPNFYAVMDPCEREVYQWIEQIASGTRPAYLNTEMQRIANRAYQQQYQQWQSCQARYYASQTPAPTGLHVRLASHLAQGAVASAVEQTGPTGQTLRQVTSKLSVPFTPGSAPPPPQTCPNLPFHYLWRVDKMGINYYPQNTQVELLDQPSSNWSGIGPWEGAKVMIVWSLNNWSLANVQDFLHMQVHVTSAKVFDHWASFKTFDQPAPPTHLLARSDPFELGALQIQTSLPYDWNASEGHNSHGWHIYVDYTHQESAQTWVSERWLESPSGWTAVGLGGYGADHILTDAVPAALVASAVVDGIWHQRACVHDFKRTATPFSVHYNANQVASGLSSVSSLVTTPYQPGVTPGIANTSATSTIRTVGATKASFRLLYIEPVAGFGVRLTLQLVNELHVAACIVTPTFSGIGDRVSWQDSTSMHFNSPAVWVVRNLEANTESAPISFLLPMEI